MKCSVLLRLRAAEGRTFKSRPDRHVQRDPVLHGLRRPWRENLRARTLTFNLTLTLSSSHHTLTLTQTPHPRPHPSPSPFNPQPSTLNSHLSPSPLTPRLSSLTLTSHPQPSPFTLAPTLTRPGESIYVHVLLKTQRDMLAISIDRVCRNTIPLVLYPIVTLGDSYNA